MASFSRTTHIAAPAKTATQAKLQAKLQATSKDFERLEKEGAKAFEAFTVYRDLPIHERSLATLSERLQKSKSLCARWSVQFRWVERVRAWDSHQDQLRRTRLMAEREKIRERQLQQNQIASQALMAPLVALAKRAQTKADAFANVPTAELTKVAAAAARSLSTIHADERLLLGTAETTHSEEPMKIVGAQFRWVQGRCTCGHTWDSHGEADETANEVPSTRCMAADCECPRFIDEDEDLW